MKFFKKALPFLIAAFAVLFDQITKWIAVVQLKPIGSVPIIRNIFHFTYTTNPGAAFSLFSAENQRWIFMVVSSVAILIMLGFLFLDKSSGSLFRAAMGAVLGGGIGNMIDRLGLGTLMRGGDIAEKGATEVVDFLDFCLINFPIFNIADCFVCVGAGLLFLAFFLDWRKEVLSARKKETAEAQDEDLRS